MASCASTYFLRVNSTDGCADPSSFSTATRNAHNQLNSDQLAPRYMHAPPNIPFSTYASNACWLHSTTTAAWHSPHGSR